MEILIILAVFAALFLMWCAQAVVTKQWKVLKKLVIFSILSIVSLFIVGEYFYQKVHIPYKLGYFGFLEAPSYEFDLIHPFFGSRWLMRKWTLSDKMRKTILDQKGDSKNWVRCPISKEKNRFVRFTFAEFSSTYNSIKDQKEPAGVITIASVQGLGSEIDNLKTLMQNKDSLLKLNYSYNPRFPQEIETVEIFLASLSKGVLYQTLVRPD